MQLGWAVAVVLAGERKVWDVKWMESSGENCTQSALKLPEHLSKERASSLHFHNDLHPFRSLRHPAEILKRNKIL